MSIAQMVKVWEHKWTHPQQVIMLALADHAHDDGTGIRPSIDRVAWKAEYSRRSVQNIVSQLVKKGVLVLSLPGAWHRPNEYSIDWSKAEKKKPFEPKSRGAKAAPLISLAEGCSSSESGVQLECARGAAPVNQECSMLHPNHQEPSVKPSTESNTPQTPQGDFDAEVENEKPAPEEQPAVSVEPPPPIAPSEVITPVKTQQLESAGVMGGGGSAAAPLAVENEIDLTAPHNAGLAIAHKRQQRILSEQEELGIRHNSTRNINTVEARLKYAGAASKWMSELAEAYAEHLAPLGGTAGSMPAALEAWTEVYQSLQPDAEFYEDFGIYAAAIAKKKADRPSTIPCNLATFIREHTERMQGAIAYLDRGPTPTAPRSGTRTAHMQGTFANAVVELGEARAPVETAPFNPMQLAGV